MAEGETAPQLRSWVRQGIDITQVMVARDLAQNAAEQAASSAAIAEQAARVAVGGATGGGGSGGSTGVVMVINIIDASNLGRSTLQAATPLDYRTLIGAAASTHKHNISDLNVTGTPSATTVLFGDGTWRVPSGTVAGSVSWLNVTDKPAVITGLQTSLDNLAGKNTEQDSRLTTLQGDIATRARLNSDGIPITGTTGTGLLMATQEFVDQRINDAASGGGGSVPSDIQAKLDAKADKVQLANVDYVVIVLAGSNAPAVRPTDAGSRPVVVRGGATTPTWIDSSKGDMWFGVPQ